MNRNRWLSLCTAILMQVCFCLPGLAFTVVELKDIAFSYRPEAEPYFVIEAAKLRNNKNGFIDKRAELDAYNRIYQTVGGQDVDFDVWAAKGGVAPKQFRIRARVKNYGNEASSPLPVTITVMAKVGEFFVDQQAFMVDQEHLRNTAKWASLQTIHGTIPVLASGETYDFYSEPILFGAYLLSLEHQFPVVLRGTVKLDNTQAAKTIEIPVNGDHFALEDLR